MKNKKKLLVPVMVVALVLATIGGTLAWLTAQTDEVKNTFTVGNVNVALAESDNLDLKMIPGKTITKDPKVTVEAGSEASYVYVKVVKSANFDKYMTYEMAEGWTQLDGVADVWYREYTPKDKADYTVLKNNVVKVKDTVTSEEMVEAGKTAPTLTVKAYAVQKENMTNAKDAWTKAGLE